MREMVSIFLRDERGQDLVEYTLMTAFIALGSASLFVGSGGELSRIWNKARQILLIAAGHGGQLED